MYYPSRSAVQWITECTQRDIPRGARLPLDITRKRERERSRGQGASWTNDSGWWCVSRPFRAACAPVRVLRVTSAWFYKFALPPGNWSRSPSFLAALNPSPLSASNRREEGSRWKSRDGWKRARSSLRTIASFRFIKSIAEHSPWATPRTHRAPAQCNICNGMRTQRGNNASVACSVLDYSFIANAKESLIASARQLQFYFCIIHVDYVHFKTYNNVTNYTSLHKYTI